MRILYVANERIPTDRANGLQIMKTCEALAKNGVELELIIPHRKTEAMSDDPFDYYRIERVFKLKKLPCLDLIPYLFFLGPVPYWLISVTFSLSAAFYSLTHGHDFLYFRYDPVIFWFFVFWKRNLVAEFHFKTEGMPKLFLRKLQLAVVINKSAVEIFENAGEMKGRVVLAPDGVSLTDFDIRVSKAEARKKLGIPDDGRRIAVYTGHFYSWKGIDALIKAAFFLKENVFIYLIGGDTPQDSPLFSQKLPENIMRLGQKNYSEIPLYLKAADCLVITGTKKDERSFRFTSPLKLFEYMASARPIIASGTESIRETLEHKKNSWLVPPDDEKALTGGIMFVLNNPGTADNFARQARIDVENYTWEKRAEIIVEALKIIKT